MQAESLVEERLLELDYRAHLAYHGLLGCYTRQECETCHKILDCQAWKWIWD